MMPRSHEQPAGEREHRSPGLGLITTHLRNEHKQNVLDLGPASTANVEFLSGLQCKVYVEHLASVLTEINASSDDADAAAADQLLPYTQGLHFDVVLAWDLMNYLEPAALDTLVARLIPFCKRGTLLFALICTGKHISDAPIGFKIAAADCLRYNVSSEHLRRSPQYSAPVLLKKLPGFSVVRSYLLQNNMQEYVFRFQ